MKLRTLQHACGWIFIIGHFSSFVLLFLWGLFWSERGFAGIADLFALLLPLTGVATLAAVKAFLSPPRPQNRKVSKSMAVLAIMLPTLLTLLIWSLLIAYVMQLAPGPDTVKLGIGLCELAFGSTIGILIEKLFPPLKEREPV